MNTTIDKLIYSFTDNIQVPDIGSFIRQGAKFFKNEKGNIFISDKILIPYPLEKPFNEHRMLADGYEEIGLWIPSKDTKEGFAGILLTWGDKGYPTPNNVQYTYLAETGHMVMVKELTEYTKVKDLTPDDIIKRFVI